MNKTVADIIEIVNKIDAFREKYRSGRDMNEDDLETALELLNEYKDELLHKQVK